MLQLIEMQIFCIIRSFQHSTFKNFYTSFPDSEQIKLYFCRTNQNDLIKDTYA